MNGEAKGCGTTFALCLLLPPSRRDSLRNDCGGGTPMSLKIGRFFGINLYLHWTFWLLPLWIILTPSRGLPLPLELGVLAFMFGCVVLHEYGHALTARRFGIATRDVTLYPIGGVARLERMSENPLEEFCIALAGPLVNVGTAVALALGLVAATAAVPGILATPAGE